MHIDFVYSNDGIVQSSHAVPEACTGAAVAVGVLWQAGVILYRDHICVKRKTSCVSLTPDHSFPASPLTTTLENELNL